MANLPRVLVDWNDSIRENHVTLSSRGSLQHIEEQKIILKSGRLVRMYGDAMEADGHDVLSGKVIKGSLVQISPNDQVDRTQQCLPE